VKLKLYLLEHLKELYLYLKNKFAVNYKLDLKQINQIKDWKIPLKEYIEN